MQSQRFKNKKILLSGGGTGIGKAIALAFAAEGASVRITGRNLQTLEEVAAQGEGRIIPISCDVSDIVHWKEIVNSEPDLDVLINNAAISQSIDIFEVDDAVWNRIMDINFKGCLHACREAARLMRARGGKIVNISSIHADICERGSTAYAIAKASMNHLTRCLAVELAPFGILVNAVAPGFVDTPMSSAGGVNELETDWFKTRFIKNGRIPLKRAAQPEEIASAVLFFASDENTYITGQILTVDGGLTLTL